MREQDEIIRDAREFLQGLIRHGGFKMEFTCEDQGQEIHVRLHGPDAGLFLQNNARLLYAVNHLLNQIFYYRARGRWSFVVDCEEYRATRVLELQLLARKAAEKVRVSNTPFSLQPMPAYERRIIHLTLAEEAGIRTESQGTGYHRKVLILPAG